MKRIVLSVLLFAAVPMMSYAKRMPYMCELVDSGNLIAIWSADEVSDMKLGAPKTVINGDPAVAMELRRSQVTDVVMRLKKGEELILSISRYKYRDKTAHIGSIWKSTDAKIKMIKDLLKLEKEIQKWDRYSVEEQVERAGMIVRGQIKDSGISVTTHWIEVKDTLKGGSNKTGGTEFNLSVYPSTPDRDLNTDSLILLQHMPRGSGPGSRIMKAIRWGDAGDYLKHTGKQK